MKSKLSLQIALGGALFAASIGTATAQYTTLPPYRGYYGGYSGPTIAVTPFGLRNLGYGYDGYMGSGVPASPDWDYMRAMYEQGYQDALGATAAQNADQGEVSYPEGMTATPRGVVGRVPHGSDGVRMWRIGKTQVALRWLGDPRIASAITFTLTDKSGRPLRRSTVRELPAEVRFTPPANGVFYEAVVHYVDGATNTIMGRLPAQSAKPPTRAHSG